MSSVKRKVDACCKCLDERAGLSVGEGRVVSGGEGLRVMVEEVLWATVEVWAVGL